MRKLLSILLLAIFALPLASPLLALGPLDDVRLPACCRRNGTHHCTGMTAEASGTSSDRATFAAASQRCPHLPAALAAVHPSPFVPSPSESIVALIASKPAINRQVFLLQSNPLDSAHPKRGPPTSL